MKQQRRFLLLCLGGTLLLIGALGAIKTWQIIAAIRAHADMGPPPQGVSTTVVHKELWQPTFAVVGTITSERGALLKAEVAGTLEALHFEAGQAVTKGDTLYTLNSSVELAQLSQAQAELELANQNLGRISSLYKAKATSKETLDNAVATQQSRRAEVARLRATIDKRSVRAPFSGTVGIRRVNVGDYVQPGTPIVELRDPSELNVDFEVSQERAGVLTAGDVVAVSARDQSTTATVTSLDPAFDNRSRTLRVRARLKDSEDNRATFRAGMFTSVSINDGDAREVIFVPSSSVVYAPFGDSVFTVEEKEPMPVVQRVIVRLGPAEGGRVPVLSGLTPEMRVVTAGAFKLQPGSPVILSDKALPEDLPLSEETS